MITTEIPPQKEYAQISGKLTHLLVSDNQNVSKYTPLAILENAANYEDVYILKSIIDTLKVHNKSFEFPIDSLPVLFLGDIDSQFALFENSYIQYKLNKELQPFSNEANANRYTISELKSRLANLKSQRDINKRELEFAKKDLDRQKSLFNKGVISAQEFENKQLQYAQNERNYKNFESSISQMQENISNARMTTKGTEVNNPRGKPTRH